jgi:hypothetical protein
MWSCDVDESEYRGMPLRSNSSDMMVLVALVGFGVLGWFAFRIQGVLIFSGQKILAGVRERSGRPIIKNGFELNGLPWKLEIDIAAVAISALTVLATAVWAAWKIHPGAGGMIALTLLFVFDSFVACVCTGFYGRFKSSK